MGNCITCGHRPSSSSPNKDQNTPGRIPGYGFSNNTQQIGNSNLSNNPHLNMGLTVSSPEDPGTANISNDGHGTTGLAQGQGPKFPHHHHAHAQVMTSSSFPETGHNSTIVLSNNGQTVINPSTRSLESTPLNGGTGSSKSETSNKKTSFYSRIPPLGRTGSVDKKHRELMASLSSNNNSSSVGLVVVKDNNNEYNESKIQELFQKYSDPNRDMILAEGIDRLCHDLELKPEDFRVLLMAWKFDAEEMCRFTRDEFRHGMKELQIDSIEGLRFKLRDLVTEVLDSSEQFKSLYRFTFKFGLDGELGERVLPTEVAISLWSIIFEHKVPLILDSWTRYLRARNIKGIPRDTWNMFLNFVQSFSSCDDLKGRYDDSEAWPSLFDDFVDYIQNGMMMELEMYEEIVT